MVERADLVVVAPAAPIPEFLRGLGDRLLADGDVHGRFLKGQMRSFVSGPGYWLVAQKSITGRGSRRPCILRLPMQRWPRHRGTYRGPGRTTHDNTLSRCRCDERRDGVRYAHDRH